MGKNTYSGLGALLKFGALLGEAAYNDSQVKKNTSTEEYKDELQKWISTLEEESDTKLMIKFHKEYDDHWGQGLFLMDANNRMDPMFMAYVEIFKQRDIERVEVRCRECDKRMGFRMIPKMYAKIKDEFDLTHGYCECKCGKRQRWEISSDYNGESQIDVYEQY